MDTRLAGADARRGDPRLSRHDRPRSPRPVSADTITLGCRLNFAESEAMRRLAQDGDLIVNSCAVTAEAVRQTRQAIRRAWRDRPGRRIVVTGCAAQLDPHAFAAMPEVAKV